MKKLVLTAFCLISGLLSYAQSKGQPDLSLNTIAIDPGHGGKDIGATSPDKKTYEKTLTLKISKKFAEKVSEAYPKMNVVMTRDKDEFIPLNLRARKATDAGAQLFISVHINAVANRSASGFSAWLLGQSKKNYDSYGVNMEVCKRENSVIYLEDDYSTKYKDLDESSPESQIFLKLMQNAFREQSLLFAENVCAKMAANGPFSKDLGVLQDNFQVLREASMPAVLLEFGFITNEGDLKQLRNDEAIETIADNLFEAFKAYKKSYDQSVRIGDKEVPAEEAKPVKSESPQPKNAESPAPKKETAPTAAKAEAPAATGTFYGTQVLASSKKMSASDRYFKGYDMKAVSSGTLYKYILCPTEDISKARENHREIKKSFPDSFVVKVVNGEISRVNP